MKNRQDMIGTLLHDFYTRQQTAKVMGLKDSPHVDEKMARLKVARVEIPMNGGRYNSKKMYFKASVDRAAVAERQGLLKPQRKSIVDGNMIEEIVQRVVERIRESA